MGSLTGKILGYLLAIIGSSFTLQLVAQDRPAQPVVVAAVELLDAAPRVWVPATVLSQTDALLGVEVAGRVVAVADPGTRLAAGDEVARLDSELWEISATDAEANVKRLQARLTYLRSEAERLTSLANVNSAARSQLDESVAEREMAIQDLSRAAAEVKRTQYLLSRTTITAPFAGQLVERLTVPGEYLAVGENVARVVDLEHLEIRAQAPLRVAPFVREGAMVPVKHGEVTVSAKVTAVIPVGDLESRSFEIRLATPSPNWVIGTPVRVGLPAAAARRIVTIPRDALVLREAGPVVFKVQSGTVTRLSVATGIGAQERIEVTSDQLAVDDLVVIKGAELLKDGQAVEVQKPGVRF